MDVDGGNNGPQETEPEQYDAEIPVTKLKERIEFLSKHHSEDDMDGFDYEFAFVEDESAKEDLSDAFTTALLPENSSKNRFINILPSEETIVPLDNASKYINANFISKLTPNSKRSYIATQGPVFATVNDLWHMVWQYDINTIVMLTKIEENGRLKCELYYPDERKDTIDTADYEVEMGLETASNQEYIIRMLVLKNKKSNETRNIKHLQYIAWPDHGVPQTTKGFLDLMDEANLTPSRPPVVVHCSAGVGRTGTFCIIDSILDKVKTDLKNNVPPKVNVIEAVLNARKERTGMVQTREQYEFIYHTLLNRINTLLEAHEKGQNGNQQNNKTSQEEKKTETNQETKKESSEKKV
eukprot:TRINITY_DN998_c0_g1_i1.p1 TRINITY_DN998_c0_g1~~TRINITY_DN998_c0_g1_i1.p1  ORF type:complete len:354 (+),score=106.24 TRINITY_DN998_c0_g1_i1:98-1159(+)